MQTMQTMNISIEFQKIRKQKSMSVYKLSKISGISENHIHNIEKDISQPSLYVLEKLLEPLGITITEFLNRDSGVYYPSDFERELLESIRTLTDEQAQLILQLIKNMNANNK